VPALNEEEAISTQIRAISEALASCRIKYEVVVVDDGSDDDTGDLASTAGARVLRHSEQRGYGAALKTGIVAAASDTLVIIDADGSYPADAIPKMLRMLETADMVVAARTGGEVHIPQLRRPAKWFLRRLATRITGRKIPDLNSGLRCFRRETVVQYFSILPAQFSFTTTITLALLADEYRVAYLPIDYYPRIGKSKIKPWHFMDFIVLVIRIAVLFQPLKVFVPIALSLGGLGILKIVFDLVAFFSRHDSVDPALLYEAVISTSALLLLLVAVQVLLSGIVADGIMRRIQQRNSQLAQTHAVIEKQSTGAHEQSGTGITRQE
jgi:glycosyltransferase involved in cell wall biosynthesis